MNGMLRMAAFPGVTAARAAAWRAAAAEVCGGSLRRRVAHARMAASYVGMRELGLPIAQVARALGVTPPVVHAGLACGRALLRARGLRAVALAAGRQRKPS